jgi:hypothetical protein
LADHEESAYSRRRVKVVLVVTWDMKEEPHSKSGESNERVDSSLVTRL